MLLKTYNLEIVPLTRMYRYIMTIENFKNTLSEASVPKNTPVLLQALWHDAKGD